MHHLNSDFVPEFLYQYLEIEEPNLPLQKEKDETRRGVIILDILKGDDGEENREKN